MSKSIEELMALASDPTQETKPLNEAQLFVIAFDIKPGTTRVMNWMIYFTYVDWRKSQGVEPIKKVPFHKQFYPLFKQYHHKLSDKYYLLDPSPFDMSVETYYALRRRVNEEKRTKKQVEEIRKKTKERFKKHGGEGGVGESGSE